ncbi:MAG: translation initiation factor IF-2, partial [Saprospiraceae bacterium]
SKTPPATTPPAPPAPDKVPGTDEAPAPDSEFYRADAPQLRGLKILGRISLDKPKPESTGGDNRGGRGAAGNRGGRNAGGGGQGGNRNGTGTPGTGGQTNRPANADGTPQTGGGNANDPRRKRTRKKVQQPINTTNVPAAAAAGASVAERRGRGPMGNRPDAPKEVSQKDIEDQIRQTMARMGAGASRKRQKVRRDKRDVRRERAEMAAQERTEGEKKLQVTEFISVSDLASMMSLKPSDIIKTCMSLGIFVSINQRLDAELIEVVASEFDFEVQFISAEEQVEVEEEEVDNPDDLVARQPIVTVMGHVDHGKTSLLDFIRSANVAEGEAGGITQHIGAYEVMVGDQKDKKITFLDTPGHEAFTAMRARGAKVTDVVIIVIAADDSVMPQTREAINHAQVAGVPIVFAFSKVDKAGADTEKIRTELSAMNLLVEEWGGKYQTQEISSKSGLGVDDLLEKVLLEAELLELKANPDRRAFGTVIEASLDKGRGYVSTVLVENGTLQQGDIMLVGAHYGRIRAMTDDLGERIKEAGPSTPVQILGLPGAPQAGDKFNVMETDREAREIANKREQLLREQTLRTRKHITLEEIGRRKAIGTFKELNVIVKGDVDGSVEALSDSLLQLSTEEVQV